MFSGHHAAGVRAEAADPGIVAAVRQGPDVARRRLALRSAGKC
jgi:hypothetical protein